ncbi:MAG: hypothetical protein ACR2P4_03195 [Gammaproteobacteria bacterium]
MDNKKTGGTPLQGYNTVIPAPSSFPRKRESKPLPFVHLRESANGGFAAANGKP